MPELREVIESVVGKEADGAEADALPGLDPIAAALAVGAIQANPALPPELKSYLEKQARLVEIQSEHLHEQREVILANLKLKRASERLKLGSGICIAAIATAVVVALSIMVWQAAHARGLVVEPFATPPDLVHDGLSGQVVAEDIEDRINALQAKTDTSRAPGTFTHDWGGEVKVEIPETGITVGEAERLLRRWLGHETRISGAVVRRQGSVKVIARVEGYPSDEASGADTDVDTVISAVAEQLYGRTQPYRYGIYLFGLGRFDDARAVWTRLAEGGSSEDRVWAREGLAFLVRDPRAQEAAQMQIARDRPDFALAPVNLSELAQADGHDELALKESRHALAALTRPDHGGVWSNRAIVIDHSIKIGMADLLADPVAIVALTQTAANLPDYSGSKVFALSERACALAAQHDLAGAREAATEAAQDDAAVIPVILKHNFVPWPHTCVAMAAGDWRETIRQLSGVQAALTPVTQVPVTPESTVWADLSLALARSGDLAGAKTLIFSTPLDCYPCLSGRGQIEAMLGDAAGSDHWFSEAARQGPSLPRAYEVWGEARLARGDLDGAAWAFGQANRRAPKWADPWKGLGDVAARRSKWQVAIKAYDKALASAPLWPELKQVRELAASHVR